MDSGDHSVMEPPVPIPNTEVKHCSADGSVAKGFVRVGRCQFNSLYFKEKKTQLILSWAFLWLNTIEELTCYEVLFGFKLL